jgi:hypothetical protein
MLVAEISSTLRQKTFSDERISRMRVSSSSKYPPPPALLNRSSSRLKPAEQDLSKPGKHPHDLDVYLDSALAIKHTGQHGNTLLSKCHRRIPQSNFIFFGGHKLLPPIG